MIYSWNEKEMKSNGDRDHQEQEMYQTKFKLSELYYKFHLNTF